MDESYGPPPPARTIFRDNADEIEYLATQVTYWVWKADLARARQYGDRLATLLGRQTDTGNQYVEEWVAVHEARANLSEAIRIADRAIDRERASINAADPLDFGTTWFKDDVRALQHALYLQADRHIRLGDRDGAKRRMLEASSLASSFDVRLDDDELLLLRKVEGN